MRDEAMKKIIGEENLSVYTFRQNKISERARENRYE